MNQMFQSFFKFLGFVLVSLILISCDQSGPEPESAYFVRTINRFAQGNDGWRIRFIGQQEVIDSTQFLFSQGLRNGLESEGREITHWGLDFYNPCNCINTYMLKRLDSLLPNRRYQVELEFTLAGIISEDSTNEGLSALNEYTIKAGVLDRQPSLTIGDAGFWRINVGTGNRGLEGPDVALMGSLPVQSDQFYISRSFGQGFEPISTDEEGNLWVILFIESFHTGKNDLILREVKIDLTRQD